MKRPLLLAHRGFSGNYPENSPLAFRMAVEKTAADGFESDVHITKDGKLVIFHDASVERTSNGTGFIKNMTYDELLSLDIGAWKSPEFAGQHIWTFGQLLDFCKETKMLLNMELKKRTTPTQRPITLCGTSSFWIDAAKGPPISWNPCKIPTINNITGFLVVTSKTSPIKYKTMVNVNIFFRPKRSPKTPKK